MLDPQGGPSPLQNSIEGEPAGVCESSLIKLHYQGEFAHIKMSRAE